MGLITKEVEMKWDNRSKKHYESKGYTYTKAYDTFIVKVEDLSRESHAEVDVECDGCKETIKKVTWRNYKNFVQVDGKYYCKRCANNGYKKWISFDEWCVENNRKDILDRWDYDLNNCKPNEIGYGSQNRHWFKCPIGIHKSEQKIICNFTGGAGENMKCNQCNSFENWCIKNNRQDILARWDYGLNKLNPSEIAYATNKKYWFKCPEGLHKSELNCIADLTSKIQNVSFRCRVCNSFTQYAINIIGENFLKNYWDYNKNGDIDPWKLEHGSNKHVYIKCQEKDYHESYSISCDNFLKGKRCPLCSNNSGKVHPLDSLGTLYPEVLKIWSSKNKKSAYEYTIARSKKDIWWKCADGKHKDYPRSISNSQYCNFQCPECVRERDESFLQEKVRLYLNELGFTVLHERNCNLVPVHPKSKHKMPYDNEIIINNKCCVLEIHGIQHYEISYFHKLQAKYNNTTPEYEFHMQKVRDRYKRIFAKCRQCEYLEIPYGADDVQETWKVLINNKIQEILNNNSKIIS
jgi:hypothetical protein